MIVPLTGIDILFAPGARAVPAELRAQVAPIWTRLTAANPHLWNGRILGVSGPQGGMPIVENGVLRGTAREDSYAAFLAWRELGFPPIGVSNLFGSALIVSSDGAMLLGRMGADTANAGRVYAVGGSLEPADVGADGRIDVIGSMERELTEETGLDARSARIGGLYAVFDGPRISVARFHYFKETALALQETIRRNLTQQDHRELDDVVIARRPGDVDLDMSMPYVHELLGAYAKGEVF